MRPMLGLCLIAAALVAPALAEQTLCLQPNYWTGGGSEPANASGFFDLFSSTAPWRTAASRIREMKDGTTHLAHKAEHAVDLEIGAVIAVTLQGGRAEGLRQSAAGAANTESAC